VTRDPVNEVSVAVATEALAPNAAIMKPADRMDLSDIDRSPW
jgi:hypothetical protein